MPRIPALLKLDYELSRELLRKAGELGLLGDELPEEHGGLGLNKVSGSLVADRRRSAATAASATTFAVQTGIGTLPHRLLRHGGAGRRSTCRGSPRASW